MNSETIYIIILLFLCADFIFERFLEGLNIRAMSPVLPEKLKGIYDEKEYKRFQSYKKENNRFDLISSTFSFIVTIIFLAAGGFGRYNNWIVSQTDSILWQTLFFMLGLSVVSTLLEVPFGWYTTFRIEEKYGFNKSTLKIWITDTIKGIFLSLIIGGLILSAVVGFYLWAGGWFWIYAWILIGLFSVFMGMFYSRLIVPLFNKQSPLEAGSLRDKIEEFATRTGFRLKNIYVIDGSKRSTKANAYFTGFGAEKRVVLYDTLLQDLTEDEIVAVLAHEIGHYRKKHTLKFMLTSLLQTGFMLWLFSLLIDVPAFSEALGSDQAYFQLGLVTFAILYSPVSMLLGICMNIWSRKNEYEADTFATRHNEGKPLVSGLKKISVKSLSNLTPHPWYEFVYYSHPSLLKRIKAIEQNNR